MSNHETSSSMIQTNYLSFPTMRFIVLFITQFVLFLVEPRRPKKKSINDIVSINIVLDHSKFFFRNNLPHVIRTVLVLKQMTHNLNY